MTEYIARIALPYEDIAVRLERIIRPLVKRSSWSYATEEYWLVFVVDADSDADALTNVNEVRLRAEMTSEPIPPVYGLSPSELTLFGSASFLVTRGDDVISTEGVYV